MAVVVVNMYFYAILAVTAVYNTGCGSPSDKLLILLLFSLFFSCHAFFPL